MIKTFADKTTAALFQGRLLRYVASALARRAHKKLQQLDAATRLDDLRLPPSNRLEPLKGERQGQWSIRVNDQWRICFVWREGDAFEVEFCDYH